MHPPHQHTPAPPSSHFGLRTTSPRPHTSTSTSRRPRRTSTVHPPGYPLALRCWPSSAESQSAHHLRCPLAVRCAAPRSGRTARCPLLVRSSLSRRTSPPPPPHSYPTPLRPCRARRLPAVPRPLLVRRQGRARQGIGVPYTQYEVRPIALCLSTSSCTPSAGIGGFFAPYH